jgi:hypothetical protein
MVALLEGPRAMVHISFNLSTPPNHYCRVGNRSISIDPSLKSNRSTIKSIKSIKYNCRYLYLRRVFLFIEVLASNYLLQVDQEEAMTDKSQIYSRTEGIEPFPQYAAADAIGMALSSSHSY